MPKDREVYSQQGDRLVRIPHARPAGVPPKPISLPSQPVDWAMIADADPAIAEWAAQLRRRFGIPDTVTPSEMMRRDASFDYPSAITGGARPSPQPGGEYHWPSGNDDAIWKAINHPTVRMEINERIEQGIPIPPSHQHLLADDPNSPPAGVVQPLPASPSKPISLPPVSQQQATIGAPTYNAQLGPLTDYLLNQVAPLTVNTGARPTLQIPGTERSLDLMGALGFADLQNAPASEALKAGFPLLGGLGMRALRAADDVGRGGRGLAPPNPRLPMQDAVEKTIEPDDFNAEMRAVDVGIEAFGDLLGFSLDDLEAIHRRMADPETFIPVMEDLARAVQREIDQGIRPPGAISDLAELMRIMEQRIQLLHRGGFNPNEIGVASATGILERTPEDVARRSVSPRLGNEGNQ